jgi:hypothetical protein
MRVLEVAVLREVRQIKLTVQMTDPDKFLTSQVPHLPKLLFRLLPRLGKHVCHNDHGQTFRQECKRTEIAHLMEHLILELQLQAQQDPDDYLSGVTEWNWTVDPRGLYHVTVDYKSEVLALAAIRLAERIIAELDRKQIDMDIHSEIARLRQIYVMSQLLDGPAVLPQAEENYELPQRRRAWEPLAPSPVPVAA